MNLQTKQLPNIEMIHPENEPAGSSGTGTEGARAARHVGESRAVAPKPRGFSRPVFVITGVALCMGLASCVAPYDSYGETSVTSYRPGYTVSSLPGDYRTETISGNTYYYHDGYYYRPDSDGYVVVDAPRSSRYYDDYSRRHQTSRDYQESYNRNDQRYDRGEFVTRLPDGYREINYRGDTYYRAGDRYYSRQGGRYVIVSSPY
jgi:hypothetical protein